MKIGLARNLEPARRLLVEGADCLLLAELFNCRYSETEFEILDESEELIDSIRRISAEYPSAYLIAGSLPIADSHEGRFENRSLVFNNGEVVHAASKIHMFRPFSDQLRFRSGEYAGTFRAVVAGRDFCCGVVICYDLRFPELTRLMMKEGLDVLFVPAHWGAQREHMFRTLLCARAIENQIFTIGANGLSRSFCFSPNGECLFESDGVIESAMVEIDLDEIARARAFVDTRRDTLLL
jgi:predicted amidohydrolase